MDRHSIDVTELNQLWRSHPVGSFPDLCYLSLDALRHINECIPLAERRADVVAFLNEFPEPVQGCVVVLRPDYVGWSYVPEEQ